MSKIGGRTIKRYVVISCHAAIIEINRESAWPVSLQFQATRKGKEAILSDKLFSGVSSSDQSPFFSSSPSPASLSSSPMSRMHAFPLLLPSTHSDCPIKFVFTMLTYTARGGDCLICLVKGLHNFALGQLHTWYNVVWVLHSVMKKVRAE